MKTTKTYSIVCPSCNAKGTIFNPYPVSTQVAIICPACHGAKTILVTEVTEDSDITLLPTLSDDPKGLLMVRLTERLTLRDVWKETGIAISTISRIENGKPARYSIVKALFNFYNSLNEKRN